MKRDFIRILIALLAVGVLFVGLLWWLNTGEDATDPLECVYLSELTDEEITDLLIKKAEMENQ